MILPTKYLSHDRALITLGGEILKHLEEPRSVSALWDCVREAHIYKAEDALISFDWFVLALNLLYAISAINYQGGSSMVSTRHDRFSRKLAEDVQGCDISRRPERAAI